MPHESKDKDKSTDFSPFQRSLVSPEEFTITFELVPSRGGRNRQIDRTLGLARELALDGRIRAVSITDNAGGSPALSPEVLGLEIKAMGLDVISHFSCKDKNRNEMESQLFGWDRRGLHNLPLSPATTRRRATAATRNLFLTWTAFMWWICSAS